jgi:hypothetical protein
MPNVSPKQQSFFRAVKGAKHDPNAPAHLKKIANSMSDSDIDDFANCLAEFKLKKAMVSILKDIREPMYLNEEEGDESIDPVANEFHVKADWAVYIKPFVGQPFSPKELEALGNFKEKQPITTARTEIWYKSKDTFGISHTTVIRKMKDSGQFSFTAFQKQEKPESPDEKAKKDQENQMSAGTVGGLGGPTSPMGGPPEAPLGAPPPGAAIPPSTTQPEQQKQEEEKEDIIVTKSILFKDDIKGAAILVEFLKKLDL